VKSEETETWSWMGWMWGIWSQTKQLTLHWCSQEANTISQEEWTQHHQEKSSLSVGRESWWILLINKLESLEDKISLMIMLLQEWS
jgi:hypothetical protein